MSPGKRAISIDNAEMMLKYVGLLQMRYRRPDYSRLNVPALRKMAYSENWRTLLANSWLDFVLVDGSLLQFRYEIRRGVEQPSFTFLHCPYEMLSYEQFLVEIMNTSYAEVRDSQWHQYEQYADMASPRPFPTPLRYDFDPGAYRPGRHPASHIHVGIDNQVRFGVMKVMSPFSFTSLVLRQVYPDAWDKASSHQNWATLRSGIRHSLENVGTEHLNLRDEDELYFR